MAVRRHIEVNCIWHLTSTLESSSHTVVQVIKQTFYVHLCSVIFLAPFTHVLIPTSEMGHTRLFKS